MRLLLLTIALFVPSLCLAAGPIPFNTPIMESIDKTRHVSGDALVGLTHVSNIENSPLKTLFAPLKGYAGELTLVVATADGRYHAEIGYSINQAVNATIALSLPATTLQWLSNGGYNQRTTALLLKASGRGGIFPVIWNSAEPTTTARAYINTERSSGFTLDYTTKERVPCEAHGGRSSLIFDQICSFPAELFKREFVEIERRDGTRVLTPVRIAVHK